MDLYDYQLGYRGLVLNGHRTSTGGLDTAKESDTIRVNHFDPSRLQQRDQREPLHLLSGGDLGDATLAFRFLSLSGIIKASSGPKLDDLVAQVQAAFHVEEAIRASLSTEGVHPFTVMGFTEVNTGRGTALADGGYRVLERYLARPAGYPIITGRRSGGDSVTFAAELVCPDVRRYIDTAESVVLNSGNGFSATCPNWNAAQGIAVAPVVTIVTSANGASNFTLDIAGDGIGALVLNLSGVGAATITVDMATGIIKIGSTHRQDLRTSGVTTGMGYVPPGGNTATATNTTNVTSVTLAYRQARG